jgi:hypothetical protein
MHLPRDADEQMAAPAERRPGSGSAAIPAAAEVAVSQCSSEVGRWQDQLDNAQRGERETRRELYRARVAEQIAKDASIASAQQILTVEERLADQLVLAEALEERLRTETAELRAEIAELAERTDRQQRVIEAMRTSLSWRLTRPLRLVKRLVGASRRY